MVVTFVYFLVAGTAVAYVTGRALGPGAESMAVFRLAGTVAWLLYGWGRVLESVWFGLPWSAAGQAALRRPCSTPWRPPRFSPGCGRPWAGSRSVRPSSRAGLSFARGCQ